MDVSPHGQFALFRLDISPHERRAKRHRSVATNVGHDSTVVCLY